jgi:endonuclease VIII
MPEGHTIHRLARDHDRWFAGDRPSVGSPQGRFADEAAGLDGCTFLRAEAFGKHLLHTWDHPDRPHVHIHLGLFGRCRSYRPPGPDPRDSVRYLLAGEKGTIHLIGATACAWIDDDGWAAIRERIGEDPLREDADPDRAYERLRRRRRPVAAVLLDQDVIAGLGNVFRADLLCALRIDPHLPARDLDRERFDALWELARDRLREGVRTRAIRVAPADEPPHPEAGRREKDRVYVYKRRRCRRCAGPVAQEKLEQRTLYWCPSCQGGGAR